MNFNAGARAKKFSENSGKETMEGLSFEVLLLLKISRFQTKKVSYRYA
jgi:hypothetical protein